MKNKLLPFLIISTSLIFVFRLFWVQIINIDDVKLTNKNSVERIYNYPERGYILTEIISYWLKMSLSMI